jgi:hypothetical protein
MIRGNTDTRKELAYIARDSPLRLAVSQQSGKFHCDIQQRFAENDKILRSWNPPLYEGSDNRPDLVRDF